MRQKLSFPRLEFIAPLVLAISTSSSMTHARDDNVDLIISHAYPSDDRFNHGIDESPISINWEKLITKRFTKFQLRQPKMADLEKWAEFFEPGATYLLSVDIPIPAELSGWKYYVADGNSIAAKTIEKMTVSVMYRTHGAGKRKKLSPEGPIFAGRIVLKQVEKHGFVFMSKSELRIKENFVPPEVETNLRSQSQQRHGKCPLKSWKAVSLEITEPTRKYTLAKEEKADAACGEPCWKYLILADPTGSEADRVFAFECDV